MATGWMKALQCKSRAYEDVITTSSCRRTAANLKDVVQNTHQTKPKATRVRPPVVPKPTGTGISAGRAIHNPFFPTLTELPVGHSSRNVVEIIFHTSWSQKAFPGRIEVIFKVHNLPKTVARFEEYREAVKARAGAGNPGSKKDEDARCVADGNEVMRFHCVGPTDAEVYDAGGLCTFSGKGGSICTFPGSGAAHESAGGGKGRRAMLVCRVIAGRVCKRVDSLLDSSACGSSAFDSVSGENGALVVFDSRALLPCFLIIYKV